MKKTLIRVLSLLMLVLVFASVIPVEACAASATVSEIRWTIPSTTNGTRDIYVMTSKKNASVKMEHLCGLVNAPRLGGRLNNSSHIIDASVYGSFEVTIWKRVGSKWVQENNYDVYNTKTKSITLKEKNTLYKIRVYAWKPQTVFNAYWNNNAATVGILGCPHFRNAMCGKQIKSGAYWTSSPSLKFSPNGCTMYAGCPV